MVLAICTSCASILDWTCSRRSTRLTRASTLLQTGKMLCREPKCACTCARYSPIHTDSGPRPASNGTVQRYSCSTSTPLTESARLTQSPMCSPSPGTLAGALLWRSAADLYRAHLQSDPKIARRSSLALPHLSPSYSSAIISARWKLSVC